MIGSWGWTSTAARCRLGWSWSHWRTIWERGCVWWRLDDIWGHRGCWMMRKYILKQTTFSNTYIQGGWQCWKWKGMKSIKFGQVNCEKEPDFKLVCRLLAISSLHCWTIDQFKMYAVDEIQAMKFEKEEVIQLTIGGWIEKGYCQKNVSPLLYHVPSFLNISEKLFRSFRQKVLFSCKNNGCV